MPLALDPSATRRLHLRSDAQIEAARRPTFVYRFLTVRESDRMQADIDSAFKATSLDDARPLWTAVLRIGYVGCANFPPEYADDPFATMQISEMVELAHAVRYGSVMDEGDEKKSESPPPSPTAT